MAIDWTAVLAESLTYDEFLNRHGTPEQRDRWAALHQRVRLTDDQRDRLGAFVRRMPTLCLAGAWCGDCVHQVPIYDHIARTNPLIELRLLDRDVNPELRDALAINGGHRVPIVVWLSEDGYEVARFGDRTLARYRDLAAQQLGPSCPTGIVGPDDELLAATVAEWVDHFERAHWILRLSARLRQKYGD